MRFGISEYPEQGIKYYDEFERIFNNGKIEYVTQTYTHKFLMLVCVISVGK
jgi:hypothetical protein